MNKKECAVYKGLHLKERAQAYIDDMQTDGEIPDTTAVNAIDVGMETACRIYSRSKRRKEHWSKTPDFIITDRISYVIHRHIEMHEKNKR